MRSNPPSLTIVVPCYNEQAVIAETASRLQALLDRLVDAGQIQSTSRAMFIDEGSRDDTWRLIEALSSMPRSRLTGLKLSRNRGHQIAVLAGLLSAPGDLIISIDADLQDDLDAIPKMVAAAAEGNEVVYGVRSDRSRDSYFFQMPPIGVPVRE